MTTLTRIARYRDLASNEVYDIIRFVNKDGITGEIEITGDQSAKANSLETALLRAGAELPQSHVDKARILKECVAATCPFYELRERAGWTEGHKNFVLPFSSIGSKSAEIRGVSKNRLPSGIQPLEVRGTLDDWKKDVASIVARSSVGVTVLSAVFAAPLLSIVRSTSSFGLCLHAVSRSGKTSLLVAAASALGAKESNELAKWCNTPTGFQQLMASANDGPLIVDDLNNLSGDLKEIDKVVRQLARTVESGSGTNRDGKYARKTGAGHDRWRCIVMTSSETSLTDTARAAGRERQQGELVRLIDVPAAASKNPRTVFDRANADYPATPDQLHHACSLSHGTAYKAYIESLIREKRKVIEQRALEAMTQFLKCVDVTAASPAIRDIATKFAVIYAGGILATEFKITGWNKKKVLASLLRVFNRIKKTFPDEQARVYSLIETLDRAIDTLPRKRELSKHAFRTADGYKIVSRNERVAVIRSEVFNRMLPDAAIRSRIANDLAKCGVLRTKKPTKSLHVARQGQSQITWPDKERRRSYRFVIRRDKSLASILGLTRKKPR